MEAVVAFRVPSEVKAYLAKVGKPTELLRPFATSLAVLRAVREEQTEATEVLEVLKALCEALKSVGVPERELDLWIGEAWGWSYGTVEEIPRSGEYDKAEATYIVLTADGPKWVRAESPSLWEPDKTYERDLEAEDLETPEALKAVEEAVKKLPQGIQEVAKEMAEDEATKRRIIAICKKFIAAIKDIQK